MFLESYNLVVKIVSFHRLSVCSFSLAYNDFSSISCGVLKKKGIHYSSSYYKSMISSKEHFRKHFIMVDISEERSTIFVDNRLHYSCTVLLGFVAKLRLFQFASRFF